MLTTLPESLGCPGMCLVSAKVGTRWKGRGSTFPATAFCPFPPPSLGAHTSCSSKRTTPSAPRQAHQATRTKPSAPRQANAVVAAPSSTGAGPRHGGTPQSGRLPAVSGRERIGSRLLTAPGSSQPNLCTDRGGSQMWARLHVPERHTHPV